MSAQMANDQNGLVAGASDDPRQPCFGSSAEAQAEIIIDKFEKLCEAAARRFQTSCACCNSTPTFKEFLSRL